MTTFGLALLVLGAAMLVVQPRTPWLDIFEGPAVVASAAGAMLTVSGLGGAIGWGLLAALVITATALAPRYWQREDDAIVTQRSDAP